MRKIIVLCGLAALAFSSVHAAEVKVQWQDPEKFTDIRPANDSRKSYRERVIRKFDEFFQQMGMKLPEGYNLDVTVTDIDLAGDVDYFISGAGNALRVVKDIYSPAMKFSYVLRDNHGEQVMQADEKLRDMGFMQSIRSAHNSDEFRYEKQMLEDWFERELKPGVEQHQHMLPKVSVKPAV